MGISSRKRIAKLLSEHQLILLFELRQHFPAHAHPLLFALYCMCMFLFILFSCRLCCIRFIDCVSLFCAHPLLREILARRVVLLRDSISYMVIHVYIYIYIHIYVYMYVYIYIYIYMNATPSPRRRVAD